MSLWQTIKSWVNSNNQQLTRTFIDDDGGEIRPHEDYFRIVLADMYLAKDRQWFRDHYPAVVASVKLNYAGRDNQEFTRLAQPSLDARGPGAFTNYTLTPLLPFRGGSVEVEGGLS